jgi:hypothetical protein
MEKQSVLEIMRAYFAGKQPDSALESFGQKFPRAFLAESMEVVDFIIYLEDKTGFHIDITEVGPAMLDKNFDELATRMATEEV